MNKNDFPVFKNDPTLVYLDSAATTLRPRSVVEAISRFSESSYGPIQRGLYPLSIQATQQYEAARGTVAEFIHAQKEEIVFTAGATDSLNLLCWSLSRQLKPDDVVLLSPLEHHSALLPWQRASKELGFQLQFCELDSDGAIFIDSLASNVKILSLPLISNVTGTHLALQKISKAVAKSCATFILDVSQAVSHTSLDVRSLGCHFLAFSSHKMYGPTGIGILWGDKKHLETLEPYRMGGEMVSSATATTYELQDVPYRFEAGTPNPDGAIGVAAAVQYLNSIGMEEVSSHTRSMTSLLLDELKAIDQVSIISKPSLESGLVSFVVEKIHPHDISELLGQKNICIRAGQQCAGPAHQALALLATCRASVGVYTTKKDIQKLSQALREIIFEVNNA